jgi:hypothetical protein
MRKLHAGLLGLVVPLVMAFPAWGANVLLIEDQGGFGTAGAILTADGHNVTVINDEFANARANLLNQAFLGTFDLVVWGERGGGSGDVAPAAVLTSLETYIQNGGHLLVTGYDTLGSPDDPGLAALVRSSTFGDLVSEDANWVTAGVDNCILNGPYGDFRNLSFSASGYDDDALTADTAQGAVALVTYPPGDRVIYTDLPAPAGSVGYWNGGVSGNGADAQPDFSNGGNPTNIFRNWVACTGGSSDLVVSYLPAARAEKVGSLIRKLSVRYVVKNQGAGEAVSSELDFYLSRDNMLSTTDVYAGTVTIPALASGAQTGSELASFLLRTPASAYGPWKVLAVADANGDNAESDETNNAAAAFVTVVGR